MISPAASKLRPIQILVEASSGSGEDGLPIAMGQEDGAIVLAVFDGLGGRPGGKEASAIASTTTRQTVHCSHSFQTWVEQLQERIHNQLQTEGANWPESRIRRKGKNYRLCTTMALVKFATTQEHILSLAWIGDSRIYWLDAAHGLRQLTEDDVQEPIDAFSLLSDDQPMSQFLAMDMEPTWHIHSWQGAFPWNMGCLIACTDGAFQYVRAPWYFEHILLNSLIHASSMDDWQDSLMQHYQKYRCDDVSLVIAPVGFAQFDQLRDSFQSRLERMTERFFPPATDQETLWHLWQDYRIAYETFLPCLRQQPAMPPALEKEIIVIKKRPASASRRKQQRWKRLKMRTLVRFICRLLRRQFRWSGHHANMHLQKR